MSQRLALPLGLRQLIKATLPTPAEGEERVHDTWEAALKRVAHELKVCEDRATISESIRMKSKAEPHEARRMPEGLQPLWQNKIAKQRKRGFSTEPRGKKKWKPWKPTKPSESGTRGTEDTKKVWERCLRDHLLSLWGEGPLREQVPKAAAQ